jgi:hypothetical protein
VRGREPGTWCRPQPKVRSGHDLQRGRGPHGGGAQIVTRGTTARGTQRSLCPHTRGAKTCSARLWPPRVRAGGQAPAQRHASQCQGHHTEKSVNYFLKIATLCLEGMYPQKGVRFFHLIFGPKNIPQVEHTIVSFGLHTSSLRGKDGQMSMIAGPLHSPKKCEFHEGSRAFPPHGDCKYRLTCGFSWHCGHGVSILSTSQYLRGWWFAYFLFVLGL